MMNRHLFLIALLYFFASESVMAQLGDRRPQSDYPFAPYARPYSDTGHELVVRAEITGNGFRLLHDRQVISKAKLSDLIAAHKKQALLAPMDAPPMMYILAADRRLSYRQINEICFEYRRWGVNTIHFRVNEHDRWFGDAYFIIGVDWLPLEEGETRYIVTEKLRETYAPRKLDLEGEKTADGAEIEVLPGLESPISAANPKVDLASRYRGSVSLLVNPKGELRFRRRPVMVNQLAKTITDYLDSCNCKGYVRFQPVDVNSWEFVLRIHGELMAVEKARPGALRFWLSSSWVSAYVISLEE